MLAHTVFIAFFLLTATTSQAADSYVVTYVYDGDTVKLRNADSEFKLRLTDIDAPERNQEYGLKARRALMTLCQGKHILVTAKITGTDQYHRSLGKLQCNHIDASTYLAEHGWAWHYEQYSTNINIHNAALKARRQKLGLWASSNPEPPWVWRHNQMH
ncbi:hypothetical protein GALL_150830 [mine drainage metagenome]|uniref:TNase-like domain-containing protein n=1 Tax=mine drainage metagenome TaxID=410659 RepID=A0A1J5S4G4_9ZZZZ